MSVGLLVGALLTVTGVVQAALPPKGASFAFHDHKSVGTNWHVELRIDPKDARKVKTLILYSQQCKATVAKADVAITDAGVVAASGGLKGGGTWAFNAVFKEPTTMVGAMRMTRADCDTGVLAFPNAITGDGHTAHSHGGGGHAHGRKFPDFDGASVKQRRQARGLQQRVLRTWRGISVAQAARLGWAQDPSSTQKTPGMFHTYNKRYEGDKRILDPRRPESLVFWRPAQGEPVILGPMFRIPARGRPSFAGPIPIYHSHGKKPKSQMTHVWMVAGAKSAWANCLPVWHLEQYNPAFKWTRFVGVADQGPVGEPC